MKFSVLPFKCPSCGSYMVSQIGSYHLVCNSCKSTKPIDAQVYVRAKEPVNESIEPNGIVKTVDCPGCGADIELKEFELSKNCPYCDNPLVTNPVNPKPPYSILPFAIDKEKARKIFKSWLGSLWFAPDSLKKLLDFEHKFQPVYAPYFSFDAKSYTVYSGQRGDAYYVEVERTVYVDGREQVVRELERRINWTYVSGDTKRDFYDILVDADSKLPEVVKGIRNYDLNRLMLFNPSFLSGFVSREYDKQMQSCYNEAKEYMGSVIYSDVLYSIGGDEQRVESINTSYSNERYEATMLPVWLSSFEYKGKQYDIAINGVTGEIAGERPYSYVKIIIAVLIVLAILSGIAYYLDVTDGSASSYLKVGF